MAMPNENPVDPAADGAAKPSSAPAQALPPPVDAPSPVPVVDQTALGASSEAKDPKAVVPRETPDPEPAPAYTDFKWPQGASVDEAGLKAATDLFKEARLPQEQAQKFIDLAVSREQAAAQKGVQAFVDLQNRWVSEIKADPDIGGDKLDASLASAARAIDRLAVPGLREALNLTGAGNHPTIVKAFVRLGQMVSEDRFRPGRDAAPEPRRTPAETIYGANGPRQSED
jgi:hypothetical protein